MTKTLITGGGGFIGSHLADAMLALGHEVIVYDNWSTGKKENIAHLRDHIQVVDGDIRDLETLKNSCKGVTNVFHEAALGSVPRSIDDPATSNEVNIVGTLNVLIAARDSVVKRFVYASSSSIYGDTPELPKHEGMPFRPKSPYALTKVAAEEYVRLFYDVYGLPTISLRYFNVFGPRQDAKGAYAAVIPFFISAMLEDKPFKINGKGLHSRDFTYIDNVVQANLKCLSAPEHALGHAYNAGAGGQYTMLDLVHELNRATGLSREPIFGPPRPGDVEHSFASIAAAKKDLGYEPQVSFSEGIDKTVASYSKPADGLYSLGQLGTQASV